MARPSVSRLRCRECGEPLEVRADLSGRRPNPDAPTLLGRYEAFLPFALAGDVVSLGEGATPVLMASSLGRLLGLERLLFKLEILNPTGSWIDRGSVASVQRARELRFSRIGTVCTGQLGASTAAYAARAGMSCVVLFGADADRQALAASALHGARLIQVRGSYPQIQAASVRLARGGGVYFANADDPFRVEGQKTLAFELAEQCPGGPPDYVVLPARGPGDAAPLVKGFREWREAGRDSSAPRIITVRVANDAPEAASFRLLRLPRSPQGLDGAGPIVEQLVSPAPAKRMAPTLLDSSGHRTVVVNPCEVDAASSLLAEEEGLLVSTESAAAVAGLIRETRLGAIPADARVVVVITGRAEPTSFSDGRPPLATSLRGLAQALADPALATQ